MAKAHMPYVAIIGGLQQLSLSDRAAAIDVAAQLGFELAKAGFGLVVYFSDANSLEPHVVSGYVKAGGRGRRGAIRVRNVGSFKEKFAEEQVAALEGLFERKTFPGKDWEAPFYRSLAQEVGDHAVDGVVLLAGVSSTLIAGQIAVARRLPVLAIDEFNGSAKKIWLQLARAESSDVQAWRDRTPKFFIDKLKRDCAAVVARRAELERRNRLIAALDARREQKAYGIAAFVVLLACLVLGTVYTPLPSVYPAIMFGGLVAAGATGAVVRGMKWASNEKDPAVSLFLGAIAGFVVGLAYLIPQWIVAHAILETTVKEVTAADKIQFVSVILVALSAGVGFDGVFRRMRKQGESASVGPSHADGDENHELPDPAKV